VLLPVKVTSTVDVSAKPTCALVADAVVVALVVVVAVEKDDVTATPELGRSVMGGIFDERSDWGLYQEMVFGDTTSLVQCRIVSS
jgi:hypothetical protein